MIIYLELCQNQGIRTTASGVTYQVVVADESRDQPATVLPQFEQFLPIQLRNEHPHGQFSLGAVLEAGDEPFGVVLAVKQMFSVQVRCQSGAVAALVRHCPEKVT